MARRNKKPVIPEPTPRFLGWTITAGLLIVGAVMVLRALAG
jgi:hypothetical protein